MLQAFINEECPIVVYPKPSDEGLIKKDLQKEIVCSLKHDGGTNPSNNLLDFSDTSKVWLQESYSSLEEGIRISVDKILKSTEKAVREEVKDLLHFSEIEQIVRTSLDEKRIISLLRRHISCLLFLEKVSPHSIKKTHSWRVQLLEGVNKIKSSLLEYKLSQNDQILKIQGTVLLLSKVIEELKSTSIPRTVMIFCSNTIFLDSDLELQGTNLIIIAPFWTILSPITLNLSGKHGRNAKDRDGKDGLPGESGENGGSFMGRASQVSDIRNLTINLSGGNGGAGSSGANGENGDPGLNGESKEGISHYL